MEPQDKRTVRATILTLVVLVLVAGMIAGTYVFSLTRNFDAKSEKITEAFPAESARPEVKNKAEDAVNILLLGSDSGEGSGETENLAGVPNAGRSDTMMLVHIPGDREGVYITSMMRDTWVDIPGRGERKLNAAYSFGGVPLTVQTIETMLDTRIDHVASVDMEGFKGLTNTLGGVDIDVPIAFEHKGISFTAGPMHMDGETALTFVRERYAFEDGDYQRVKNQQLFLDAVMGKLLARDTLTNPGRVASVVDELSPYVGVDDSLNAVTLGRLGVGMSSLRQDDVHFFALPTEGVGRSADGQSIVLPDIAAINDLGEALSTDEVAGYVESNGP
ncbi:LCP family protein [Arthrobacter sp. KK5.5]|uniref:LCP family protein n=1 Tax=Arthrobacter sp. KK5.5 TaxID=3373084 RepID=UPI003EE64E2E